MSHPIVENVVIIGAGCACLMAAALAVSVAESFLFFTVIAVGLSTPFLLLPSKKPRITAELANYRRSAVPFNLIWKPVVDAPVILSETLPSSTVFNALRRDSSAGQ